MSEPNKLKNIGIVAARASNFEHGQVTITGTATQIRAAQSDRNCIIIINGGSVNVYIGASSSVTVSNGFLLAPGSNVSIEGWDGSIYGIISAGSSTISFAELF